MYKRPLEKSIERYLVDECRKHGIIAAKQTGFVGIPDRLLIGHGQMFFVELKRPGEKPRASQIEAIKRLEQKGATVYVADSREQVREIINMMESGGMKNGKENGTPANTN